MLCKYCNIEKPKTSFEVANIIGGKKYLRLKCKLCKQAQQNKRRRDIRQNLVQLKNKLCCAVCLFDDYRCLDFHHVDPKTKLDSVANLVKKGWGWDKIQKEIEKCVVLCSNCHRIKHYAATPL